MFVMCARMKWNHLPSKGALYDQDPDLLDKFDYLFSEIERHEREEQAKQERENARRGKSSKGSRGRGRSARVMN